MAVLSGTGARIYVSTSTGAGTGASIDSMTQWTMNVSAGVIATNAFGSSWASGIAGLRSAQGSGQGFWNFAGSTEQKGLQANALAGEKCHFQLYTDLANTEGYEFDGWVSGLQVQAQVDGAVGFSFDFTADGAVTFSTALT